MPAQGRDLPGLGARAASLAVLAVLAAVDQASKAWAFALLPGKGDTRPVLPPVLSLTHSENPGIFMGIGSGISQVFTFTSFLMLGVLVWILWTKTLSWPWRLSVAAIASGALGNGLDRWRLKAVRDFLDFHYRGWTYPTFNAADICICVGAAVLAIGLWKAPEPKRT